MLASWLLALLMPTKDPKVDCESCFLCTSAVYETACWSIKAVGSSLRLYDKMNCGNFGGSWRLWLVSNGMDRRTFVILYLSAASAGVHRIPKGFTAITQMHWF